MRRRTFLTLVVLAALVLSLAVLAGQPDPQPKAVHWVCTDHVCGGCDGQCPRYEDHVAVSRRGRCACTPREGSGLDRAIRKAFHEHESGR